MIRPKSLSRPAARRALAAVCAAAALAGCTAARAPQPPPAARGAADAPRLSAPDDRISDEAIQRDHRAYESVQARIRALNERGRPLRDAALAKAQCWLDVGFHEYTRNDRSAFPQAALDQSARLIGAMEGGVEPDLSDTPLVNGAARLRPDLWARSAAVGRSAGAACGRHRAACAEVELVHAGNEFNQQQWRHAAPYIQIAEDLLADAEALAARCPAAPAPQAAPPARTAPAPVPTPAAAPPDVRTVGVLFGFNRSGLADIPPASLAALDETLARVGRDGLDVAAVRLAGHADRLNETGNAAYNQRLSEQRVATVRGLLVDRGVEAARISTAARGDAQPVVSCTGRHASRRALTECLQPNRRVEVMIEVLPRR